MELKFKNELAVTVEFDEKGGGVAINGQSIPAASIGYLIVNGLKQSLADSYAAAKTDDEVLGLFDKRLTKIMAGEMVANAGGGGGRVDDVTKLAREMATIAVRAAVRASGKKADASDITRLARELVESQPQWREKAAAQLADTKPETDAILAAIGLE